jgi:Mn-dependent DtxR family transcriptional regulator
MRRRLTPGEKKIFEVYSNFEAKHGEAPTAREAAALANKSLGSIQWALMRLEAKGWIRREPGWRGVRLISEAAQAA